MSGTEQNDSNSIVLRRNANGPLGTFTWNTATSTFTVANTSITANSLIEFFAINASAAVLLSSKGVYPSTLTPGTGFVAGVGTGANAAGTEQIGYRIYN